MKYTWPKTQDPIANNLGKQLEKIVRSMNQNQFTTRYRYLQGAQRFINHIAPRFRLQRLANIQDKHLESYTEYLLDQDKSSKYIKTELSAIRYIHNNMAITKYELEDGRSFNQRMKLGSTSDGRIDRAWSHTEYESFIDLLKDRGDIDAADLVSCIRYSGLRLDEACTLKASEVKRAIRSGSLDLTNTKGGVPRSIPLSDTLRKLFKERLGKIDRTEYIFTPAHYVLAKTIHKYEKRIQNLVYKHRDSFQESDRHRTGHNVSQGSRGALTIHGLRHAYARDIYYAHRNQGKSKYYARKNTAKLLGHGRDNVTKIYLSKLEG